MPDLSNTLRGQPTRGFGAVLLTLGGVVAAFGVASCCGLPFILATLGLGTPGWVVLRCSPRLIG
jgi:mercuric ion transport protein